MLKPVLNTAVSYLWQDGSTRNFYQVTKPDTYTLLASNSCGRLSDAINIIEGLCMLELPAAFTPNGDGLNDLFRIKYPFEAASFKLTVYNRMGQVVFETDNMLRGWDGRFNGIPQEQASYVWIVQATDQKGHTQQKNGTILLIR